MSEMVERVARAIWALYEDTDCHEYDELAAHAKAKADDMARAAIAAMREPTEDMLRAGHKAINENFSVSAHVPLEDSYRAMIDEALR